jgi:very-short-patch-repair endonuclease
MLDEARRYFPRLRPGQFFSHTDALAMVGAPTPPGWRPGLHIAVHRPRYPPQTVGVVGHRLQTRDAATLTVAGLPVEHPARAWVQAASLWPTDDLIAAADFLVARRSPLVSLDELRSEAILIRRPGLVTALEEVRDGSESPQETKLRLAVVRAGLPEPQLNWELRDATGRFVARLDQAYPEYRVGVEYDGRQHAADVVQFARDADRWEAIRDEGWLLVRVLNHHLARGGETAVGKVRAALLSAGWRPDVGKFPFQR